MDAVKAAKQCDFMCHIGFYLLVRVGCEMALLGVGIYSDSID